MGLIKSTGVNGKDLRGMLWHLETSLKPVETSAVTFYSAGIYVSYARCGAVEIECYTGMSKCDYNISLRH